MPRCVYATTDTIKIVPRQRRRWHNSGTWPKG